MYNFYFKSVFHTEWKQKIQRCFKITLYMRMYTKISLFVNRNEYKSIQKTLSIKLTQFLILCILTASIERLSEWHTLPKPLEITGKIPLKNNSKTARFLNTVAADDVKIIINCIFSQLIALQFFLLFILDFHWIKTAGRVYSWWSCHRVLYLWVSDRYDLHGLVLLREKHQHLPQSRRQWRRRGEIQN